MSVPIARPRHPSFQEQAHCIASSPTSSPGRSRRSQEAKSASSGKNVGVPAKKLAAILGITPETLSRVENGKQALHPGLEHLVRLMGRAAAGSQTMREAVLEVAEAFAQQAAGRKATRRIQLRPDRAGGWKAAA